MSRAICRLVMAGAVALAAATAWSSAAQARGLRIRIGGGPIGVVRSVAGMALGGLHGGGRRGERVRLARDEATGSIPRGDPTRSPDWIVRPVARVQVAAGSALAGWHGGRGVNGWWQHGDGSYGWVGPLFWPFAYYDIYDYAMWGYGYDDPFWDYGYGDIYAGLFSPYGYDDLAGYLPQGGGGPQASIQQPSGTSAQAAVSDQLAQMCGEDSRDIAGLPIDQIQQAITPNDAQRAALDDLANASVKAAQDIRAACPTQIALTAPARLAAMQQRIEAMISAVKT